MAIPDKNNQLALANKEITFQKNESAKLAAQLIKANKELAFANAALALQNEEKEKRAAELLIANQELLFQNSEKGKRALELEAANKELESFTYSVSHDLRAPLRAINGFTQILVEDYLARFDEEGQDILKEIIANSKKMGELIDNLLEFSRLGKTFKSTVIVNVEGIVAAAIKQIQSLHPKKLVTVNRKKLDDIKGDKNMLQQVFINLISNAFKYTGNKEKPTIEIGSYREAGNIVYYVKDNGAGFDMRYYDKLFGVFQRLHSSTEFEGTGVGLAIIEKIIIKHGGKVWADAKVNEGACFYISLPNI